MDSLLNGMLDILNGRPGSNGDGTFSSLAISHIPDKEFEVGTASSDLFLLGVETLVHAHHDESINVFCVFDMLEI